MQQYAGRAKRLTRASRLLLPAHTAVPVPNPKYCTSAQNTATPALQPQLFEGLEAGRGGQAAPQRFLVAFFPNHPGARNASLDQSDIHPSRNSLPTRPTFRAGLNLSSGRREGEIRSAHHRYNFHMIRVRTWYRFFLLVFSTLFCVSFPNPQPPSASTCSIDSSTVY